MSFQIAIARMRGLPTIDYTVYATAEEALEVAEKQWRDDLRSELDPDGSLRLDFRPQWTGDLYVIPAVDRSEYVSSADVRSRAVHSLAFRNWHEAFTKAEMTAWEAGRAAA